MNKKKRMVSLSSKYIIVLCLAAWAVCGCSTTKRLADDETLYTGVRKMKVRDSEGEKLPSKVESEVKDPLSVKPNNPLYSPYVRTPLPIGLWVWNYFYTEKKSGFRYWIYRKLAKQPVLISDVQPELRVQLVEDILDNYGYFGSDARHEVIGQKNPKKARVSYFVEAAPPWFYDSIAFPPAVDFVTAEIDSISLDSRLHKGDRYDIDTLSAERIRITNNLRNKGFYYFRPDFIQYQADTTRQRYKVDLRMVLDPGTPTAALLPHNIGEIKMSFFNPEGGKADSVMLGDIKVWYQKPLKIRKKLLARSIEIKEGDVARVENINSTLNNLTKLGIFRYVNLNVTPIDSLSGAEPIDMDLTAAFDSPLDAEFEADFASKSNSFIGPGATFGVRHKNLIKGGEVLSVKLNGSYEWQTGNTSSQANSTAINSYELGVTASLVVPRLLLPHFIYRNNKYDRRTTFQLGASLLNRPRFFTLLSFNGSVAFDFQTSQYSFHNITILKMVYNRLLKTTSSFDDVMNTNPAIAESFRNQLIPSASYTYTFDNGYGRERRNRIIWQSTISTAGNIFSGVSSLFSDSDPKKIFNVRFSQFVKGVTEIKDYYQIGRKNVLASRLGIGIGYPYGNSTVLPYSEQFYVGGANSIRAFTVRSLGPGSYRPSEDDTYGYFDQTGEIKLEANIEFRFGIIGGLQGAVFVDAGNVWLIKEDESRPGGKITFRNFWNEIALGTGAGLRYDLKYLVIRADLGIGIHTPYKNPDKGGYYNISRFKDGLGFHLAIGYPF